MSIPPDFLLRVQENPQIAVELYEALDAAYALAIGWAGHYQFTHQLSKPHSTHQVVLDHCQKALDAAKGFERAAAHYTEQARLAQGEKE